MGFSRGRSSSELVENPILLYFLACLSTIHSDRKADGPGNSNVPPFPGARAAQSICLLMHTQKRLPFPGSRSAFLTPAP